MREGQSVFGDMAWGYGPERLGDATLQRHNAERNMKVYERDDEVSTWGELTVATVRYMFSGDSLCAVTVVTSQALEETRAAMTARFGKNYVAMDVGGTVWTFADTRVVIDQVREGTQLMFFDRFAMKDLDRWYGR